MSFAKFPLVAQRGRPIPAVKRQNLGDLAETPEIDFEAVEYTIKFERLECNACFKSRGFL